MKKFNNISSLKELIQFVDNKSEDEFIKEIEPLIKNRTIKCPNNFGLEDYCYDGNGDCNQCMKNLYFEIS